MRTHCGWWARALGVSSVLLLLETAAWAVPRIERTSFGAHATHEQVHSFTLANDHGISVKLLDLGGVITELNVPDRHCAVRNIVLGLGDPAAYRSVTTMNAIIGRYANRLRDGFTLDGQHYALTANPKGITLHGGTAPYGARLWDAVPASNHSQASVSLSLISPDGDQGFPGQLHLRVTYTLNDGNDFRIDYEAFTDKATVVNLTNHLYFNLAGNGSGTVYGQQLQVYADSYTPIDEDLVPTGTFAPVAGTALDFRALRYIGARVASAEPQMVIARGYDHNFVLRKPVGESMPLAARMFDPHSGRLMELRTTEPGLQVYSSNMMTGALVSAAGTTLRQGDGLALEPQHFPNSPNLADFPSTVLRPGEVLHSSSLFHFEIRHCRQDCCQSAAHRT